MTNSRDPVHPVTLDELLNRCMGELQFAQNILQSFLESCPTQLDEILAVIESDDAELLAQKIHRLKGTAATVAAQPLRLSLEKLETLARSDNPDRSRQLREQFADTVGEYHRVSEFVDTQLLQDRS